MAQVSQVFTAMLVGPCGLSVVFLVGAVGDHRSL